MTVEDFAVLAAEPFAVNVKGNSAEIFPGSRSAPALSVTRSRRAPVEIGIEVWPSSQTGARKWVESGSGRGVSVRHVVSYFQSHGVYNLRCDGQKGTPSRPMVQEESNSSARSAMQSRNGLNCLSNENERRSTTRRYLGSWRSLNTKLRVWRSRCEPLFELKLELRAGSPLAGRHPGLFPEKAAEIMFVVEADFEGDFFDCQARLRQHLAGAHQP